jgi:hypothetical protein
MKPRYRQKAKSQDKQFFKKMENKESKDKIGNMIKKEINEKKIWRNPSMVNSQNSNSKIASEGYSNFYENVHKKYLQYHKKFEDHRSLNKGIQGQKIRAENRKYRFRRKEKKNLKATPRRINDSQLKSWSVIQSGVYDESVEFGVEYDQIEDALEEE